MPRLSVLLPVSLRPLLAAFRPALLALVAGASACSSTDPPPSNGAGGSSGGSPSAAGAPSNSGGSSTLPSAGSGGSPSAGSSNAGAPNGAAGAPATGGGGSAGTAGSLPQAGAAGSAAGSTGGGGAPANVILSTDFESDSVGKQPTGWHNFIAYNTDTTNPQGTGQNAIEAIVDATRPHGGKNSLHVIATGSNPVFVTMPLPSGANKLYVRGYFYMTRQLGQNPGANHETLLGIRKDKDNEIRFGEIKGVIGVNEVPTDNITPKMDLWGKGPLVAAGNWACIEVAFIGDQAQHELHAWADGTDVLDVTSGDQWQNGTMPATWLAGKWNEFMIGWQSFSNASNELWIDDLVLATSRVNCQ